MSERTARRLFCAEAWRTQVRTRTGFRMPFWCYLLLSWLGWGFAFGCFATAIWFPWGGPVVFGLYSIWCLAQLMVGVRRSR